MKLMILVPRKLNTYHDTVGGDKNWYDATDILEKPDIPLNETESVWGSKSVTSHYRIVLIDTVIRWRAHLS